MDWKDYFLIILSVSLGFWIPVAFYYQNRFFTERRFANKYKVLADDAIKLNNEMAEYIKTKIYKDDAVLDSEVIGRKSADSVNRN